MGSEPLVRMAGNSVWVENEICLNSKRGKVCGRPRFVVAKTLANLVAVRVEMLVDPRCAD